MTMSVQDQIAPYLNRFVILLHQKATAKLDLNCKDKLTLTFTMILEKLKKLLQTSFPTTHLLTMRF